MVNWRAAVRMGCKIAPGAVSQILTIAQLFLHENTQRISLIITVRPTHLVPQAFIQTDRFRLVNACFEPAYTSPGVDYMLFEGTHNAPGGTLSPVPRVDEKIFYLSIRPFPRNHFNRADALQYLSLTGTDKVYVGC